MNLIHNANVLLISTEGRRRERLSRGTEFIPHARRRDAKTDAIVRAALRLLVAEGLGGVTLQRVAGDLGIATTAIYRYFPSKGALLAALQRQAIVELHGDLTATLAALEPTLAPRDHRVAALARVIAVARFYQDLPRTHPDTYHLVAVLLGDPRRLIADEHAAAAVPLLTALLDDVQRLLADGVTAGAFDAGDPRARALTLWSTLHGLNALGKLARLAPPASGAAEVGQEAVRTLLRGFGAERALIRRAEEALETPSKGTRS